MNNLKLALITLISLNILLYMHISGMDNHLYVSIWYYDIIAHTLGGFCLALSSLYILKNPKYIVLITFLLGIAWELFEIYYNITGHPVGSREYAIDTTKDLIMDTIGALIVWFVAKKKRAEEVLE